MPENRPVRQFLFREIIKMNNCMKYVLIILIIHGIMKALPYLFTTLIYFCTIAITVTFQKGIFHQIPK